MPLSPQELLGKLQNAPDCTTYVVALSGGMDSCVLLHALAALQQHGELGQEITALHINHGLQAAADVWQAHCESLCAQLAIPLTCLSVKVSAAGSLENAARLARYEAFSAELGNRSVLLQAHHVDDQMETFLQRLLRGAGVKGLAGMPVQRGLGRGHLYRPLLQHTHSSLQEYAAAHGLQWQEDSSNLDQSHDRNFLRHSVLPQIAARWPDYRASLGKSLALLNDSAELLAELAAQDLLMLESASGSLHLPGLRELSVPRQKNLLRYWLANLGLAEPGWYQLDSIVNEFLQSAHREGALSLGEGAMHVFNDQLYVLKQNVSVDPIDSVIIQLDSDVTLALPDNGELRVTVETGSGIASGLGELQVRYREGGEQIQLPGRPRKSLKNLFQESQTPPWLRDRMPLLFHNGELVCVPGLGIAQGALATAGESACNVEWRQPGLLLGGH